MRITEATCDGGATGSGFLVDARHVATVAHVVAGATSVVVRDSTGRVARGTVIGRDPDREVALVALDRKLNVTKALTFSDTKPQLLDDVVAIGFPLGRPVSVTQGEINALEASVDITDGPSLDGLLQFNADINHGSSGGPLIDSAGQVMGLAEAETEGANGLYYAVPAAVAQPLVQSWERSPDVEPPADCPERTPSLVDIESVHPDAPAVASALRRFVAGINAGTGDLTLTDGSSVTGYELAAATLTKGLRATYPSAEALQDEYEGYTFDEVTLEKVNNPGPLEDTADVSFYQVSSSNPEATSACTPGLVRFTLRLDSGQWKLAKEKVLDDPASC